MLECGYQLGGSDFCELLLGRVIEFYYYSDAMGTQNDVVWLTQNCRTRNDGPMLPAKIALTLKTFKIMMHRTCINIKT